MGQRVGMAGEGVCRWEPEIRWEGEDMVGAIRVGDSLILGELSAGSVSGEESELWASKAAKFICCVVREVHS